MSTPVIGQKRETAPGQECERVSVNKHQTTQNLEKRKRRLEMYTTSHAHCELVLPHSGPIMNPQ